MAKKRNTFKDWLKEELKDPEFAAHYKEARARIQAARRLAAIRKKAGLTQKKLAARLKVPQQNVARIESGTQNMTIDLTERAADALGYDMIVSFKKRRGSKAVPA